MNKHFRKVLELLKTRKEVKALGFSRKELKGVAAKIADKLDLKDEATDEEVTEAIDDEIDSVLPFLQLSQSMVDRRIEDFKKTLADDDDDSNDDDDEPSVEPKPKKTGKKNGNSNGEGNDELAKLLKGLQDELTGIKGEIASIKSGKTESDRMSRLKEVVKNTGSFGERIIKAASRMTFKDEDDFDDYLDEVKEDLEKENQDRANKGLEKLGNPPAAQPGKPQSVTPSEELLSDDELKSIASL